MQNKIVAIAMALAWVMTVGCSEKVPPGHAGDVTFMPYEAMQSAGAQVRMVQK